MKKVPKQKNKNKKDIKVDFRVSQSELKIIEELAHTYVGGPKRGQLSKWVRFASINHWNENKPQQQKGSK